MVYHTLVALQLVNCTMSNGALATFLPSWQRHLDGDCNMLRKTRYYAVCRRLPIYLVSWARVEDMGEELVSDVNFPGWIILAEAVP